MRLVVGFIFIGVDFDVLGVFGFDDFFVVLLLFME